MVHADGPRKDLVFLVIGGGGRPAASMTNMLSLPNFHFADYESLGAGLIAAVRPDIVLSPLMGPRFDALDMARCLCRSGFSGLYRAVAASLPRTDLICREVRATTPDLDFGIVTVDEILGR